MVGLGGTGRDAVLNVKRKLRQVYGDIPPTVKFLVFDTTQPTYQPDGEKLEGGEFVPIQVEDAAGLIRTQPDIRKWFPDHGVPIRSAIDGAGQIRGVGRMALFANSKSVLSAIRNVVGKVRDFSVGRVQNDKYEVMGKHISINIVTSLGGGTGSGTFLDVAFLFRNSGLDSNDKIVGYLLLPSIFKSHPFTDNVEPNAYAALKELEYYMCLEGQSINQKYGFGDEQISMEKPPFNLVYLVDNINKQNTEYREIEDLTEFLGTGLLLSCGALAKGSSDTLDNATSVLSGLKKIQGKRPLFSSFGVSEVFYDGRRLADLVSREIALKLINIYEGEVNLDVSNEVESLIDVMNIREDRDRDDVIDAIIPPSKLRAFELPDARKGAAQRIIETKTLYTNRAEEETLQVANKNFDNLLQQKLKALRKELEERINSGYGITHSEKFVNILCGRLDAFKSMMLDERNEYEVRRKKTQSKYDVLVEDVKKAETKMLGTTRAVQEACANYQRNAMNEAMELREKKRRERGADFYSNLLAEMKGWQSRVNEIKGHLSRLTQSLSNDIQRAQGKKPQIKAFAINLDDYLLSKTETGTVNLSDFITWLKNSNRSITEWPDMQTPDVEKVILEYCGEQKVVKQLVDTDIETELKKLPEAELASIVTHLDEMAAPLWQYTVEARNKTQTIYMFGVPDKDETIMRRKELLTKLTGSIENPSCVATGDPHRIIFFKTEVAIPGFTIHRAAKFREDYLDENAPFNYHTDKNMEANFPDLFPESDDEQGRRYWSIALAPEDLGFGFIRKQGQYYYARSESMGNAVDKYMVKLAQGRREAMKMFMSNVDLIREIRESVESQAKRLGNDSVATNLAKYRDQLISGATGAGDDIKKQVDLEIKDIDDYVKSLKSL